MLGGTEPRQHRWHSRGRSGRGVGVQQGRGHLLLPGLVIESLQIDGLIKTQLEISLILLATREGAGFSWDYRDCMAVDSDGGVGSTCRVLLDSRGAQGRAVLVTPGLPWWHPGPSTWGAAPASPPGAPIPHAGRWPRGHRVPAMPLAAVPGEAGGAVLWLGATRVRGLRRRRCLPSQRACAWPSGRRDCAALAAWGGLARGGGAELSPPSPPRWSGGCGWTVGLSVPPSVGVDRPQWSMRLCLAVVRGDGKGTRKSMALFCSLGDG